MSEPKEKIPREQRIADRYRELCDSWKSSSGRDRGDLYEQAEEEIEAEDDKNQDYLLDNLL